MELKILYLYYDLMNLYGENGNLRVLKKHLTDQGIAVTVEGKTLTDTEINFMDYDMVYAGSGTESARNAALAHLSQFQGALHEAAQAGAVMLFTGNAWEMLGTKLTLGDHTELSGLGLCDFSVTEHAETRYTGDVIVTCDFLETPCVGFINKCSETTPVPSPLFHVLMGQGNAEHDENEGLRMNQVYGTHLIGPVLVRNPPLMAHFVKKLCEKIPDFQYREIAYPYEEKAYAVTLSALKKRYEKS